MHLRPGRLARARLRPLALLAPALLLIFVGASYALIAGRAEQASGWWPGTLALASITVTVVLTIWLTAAAVAASMRSLRANVESHATLAHSRRLMTLREAHHTLASAPDESATWARAPMLAVRVSDACHAAVTVGPPGAPVDVYVGAPEVDRGSSCCALADAARAGAEPPLPADTDAHQIAVPITRRGEPLGTLYLARPADADPFTVFDESLVLLLADYASLAAANARPASRTEDAQDVPPKPEAQG